MASASVFLLPAEQSAPAHSRAHGLVTFSGDLLQRPILIELVGDFFQLGQPFLYSLEFPLLPLSILPLLGLLDGQEHPSVVSLCHRCPLSVAANILQHQRVQCLPADGVGGAAALTVVLVDPAGKAVYRPRLPS